MIMIGQVCPHTRTRGGGDTRDETFAQGIPKAESSTFTPVV